MSRRATRPCPTSRSRSASSERRARSRRGTAFAVHSGLNVTDDAFYAESPEWTTQMSGLGLLNVEMESCRALRRGAAARPPGGDGLRGLQQPRRGRERVRLARPARRRLASQHRGRAEDGGRPVAVTDGDVRRHRRSEPPYPPRGLDPAANGGGARRAHGMSRRPPAAGRRRCGCARRGRSRRSSRTWRPPIRSSRHPMRCGRIVTEAVEDAGVGRRRLPRAALRPRDPRADG